MTRRRDDRVARRDRTTTRAAPAPIAPPLTGAWASAVGNQRVARMAAEYAEEGLEDPAADESAELLEGIDEALALVDEEPAAGEGEGVALARQPTKTKPRTK